MSAKVGDHIWVSDTVSDIPSIPGVDGYVMIQADGDNEWMVMDGAWIPDSPALISVARWMAEHGEEMLADLVSVGAHEIGDVWNAEQFGDAAYRETVKRAGLALIAALEEGTR